MKAYELISVGNLNKNGKNEINWFALKEEFINEEGGIEEIQQCEI